MTALPGTYALILHSTHSRALPIGRLGEMQVEPGYYIYVGSAFGPGGLRGRLMHHLRPPIAPHWHVDYLRRVAEVVDIWAVEGLRSGSTPGRRRYVRPRPVPSR